MYIAVTGMVGSGKSTLARLLAERLGGRLFTESVESGENPWLERFYQAPEERARWTFNLKLHFLVDRFHILSEIHRTPGLSVADQHLGVDWEVFAQDARERGALEAEDYRLLERTYQRLLEGPVPRPDLLVYLHGPLPLLLERIRSRDRAAEREVPIAYWEGLYPRFQRYMEGYRESPVLPVDVSRLDPLLEPGDLEPILMEARRALRLASGSPMLREASGRAGGGPGRGR